MGCLPAVRRALDRGEKRAQAFFDDVKVLEFPQARVLEAEPMGGCFVNANTCLLYTYTSSCRGRKRRAFLA